MLKLTARHLAVVPLAAICSLGLAGASPAAAASTTTTAATGTSTSTWQENLSAAQPGDVNISRNGQQIRVQDAHFHPASSHQTSGYGTAILAAHRLTSPADVIDVRLADRQPIGSAVEVEVRGQHDNGQWTEWFGAGGSGSIQLPQRVGTVQARVTLHDAANGASPVLTGLTLSASVDTAKAAIVQPAVASSYQVYATDEQDVGQQTANGHVIVANDHFVALPSGSALSPKGSTTYSVQVCAVRCETAPVWDVGPWNVKDNYWDPASQRQEFTDLAQGVPEAQAAYKSGYNGGHSDSGQTVANPAGIDLADGTFSDIGLTDNGYVTVTYLWTTAQPSATDDGTNDSVVTAPNGHMYKFARGTDGTLRMWSSDFTTGWVDKGTDLGGNITGSPTAVIAPNGHMYVFARGTDNQLRMWSSDFTNGWTDQGVVVAGGAVDGSTPNAVIAPNGHMYVFARGLDSQLRMWSSDFTSGWVDQGAVVAGGGVDASSPNAVIAPNGHMYVFARGTDSQLRMWSSDFTTGWVDQGAIVAGGAVVGGAPTSVIAPNKHMYVFARGTDNQLRMWSSDLTTGWVDKGAAVAGGAVDGSAPNAVIGPNGHMYIFAQGTDSQLRMWSSDFTTGWVDKGTAVAGGAVDAAAPDAVIAPDKHMYVFARGTDNQLRMWSSDFTTGWTDQGTALPGGAIDAS